MVEVELVDIPHRVLHLALVLMTLDAFHEQASIVHPPRLVLSPEDCIAG